MLIENTSPDVFSDTESVDDSVSSEYVTREEFRKFKEYLINIARSLNILIDF
jgi:hypothetical protein